MLTCFKICHEKCNIIKNFANIIITKGFLNILSRKRLVECKLFIFMAIHK